jgi:hypothetical protein
MTRPAGNTQKYAVISSGFRGRLAQLVERLPYKQDTLNAVLIRHLRGESWGVALSCPSESTSVMCSRSMPLLRFYDFAAPQWPRRASSSFHGPAVAGFDVPASAVVLPFFVVWRRPLASTFDVTMASEHAVER